MEKQLLELVVYQIHQIRVQVWKNDMISGENSTGIGVLT